MFYSLNMSERKNPSVHVSVSRVISPLEVYGFGSGVVLSQSLSISRILKVQRIPAGLCRICTVVYGVTDEHFWEHFVAFSSIESTHNLDFYGRAVPELIPNLVSFNLTVRSHLWTTCG